MLSNPIICVLLAASISLSAFAHVGSDVTLIRTGHFQMGSAEVSVCKEDKALAPVRQHKKRHQSEDSSSSAPPSMPTFDLTPAKFNTTCYPGTFQAPPLEDCEMVIRAQLYNSTGSLHAAPGEYVFVSYGNCATVFQNPQDSEFNLEYNWAELGAVAAKLASRCLLHDSMGGAAMFKKYLDQVFPEVVMSLQRFDDRDFIIPA